MQIRCYRCGWSFAIKKDEAAFALQALEETHGTHYDSNCPRCRHSNRISLEQLRKAAPRSADAAASAEPQAAEDVGSGERESETAEMETESEDEESSAKPEQAEAPE